MNRATSTPTLILQSRNCDHLVSRNVEPSHPDINGLTGTELNPTSVEDAASPTVTDSDDALFIDVDPDHSFQDIIVVISLKPKALLDQFPIEAGVTLAIKIAMDVDELDAFWRGERELIEDQPRTFSQEVISSSPAARFRCGGDGQHGGERRRFAVRREDDGGWRGANGRSFVNAVVARKPAATARRSSEVEDGGGFRVVMTAAVRRKGGWCRERRG
ncbi:Non-specific phospholipase [Vigna angularis]|uniref:Non-specific phospholipase n=1 Tax=Phaseolus angularis TaxID=3914 RepID=A0A8T0KH74_PHAAN|nr:Non-specific phospholipase [Vigna angularis]